jgi:putative DNA primase/helicase
MSGTKIDLYDIVKSIIYDKKTQLVKTNEENDIIYLYQNGYWDYRKTIPLIKKQIQSLLKGSTSKHKVREILGHIRRETYFDPKEIGQNRKYLCLENCVYDLDTGRVLPHSPDLFATVKLPITYDSSIPTTDIERYISTLVKKSDIPKLQEHLGDILSPHTETKKLLYLYGDKDSGKTTLNQILQLIINEPNYCSLSLKQLTETFTNFGIYGRIANICSEMPYKISLSNIELIKAMTGGDTITIQQKFKPAFEYRPIIKHIFGANGIPHIDLKYTDTAFYGRFDFIFFPNRFKPDETIVTRYTTERMKSAWLNWLLEGYHRLKTNRWLITNHLSVKEVEQLFKDAVLGEDMFLKWLSSNYTTSVGDYIVKSKMYKDYCKILTKISPEYCYTYEVFCRRVLGNPVLPVSSRRKMKKGKQVQVFKGIKKM